jgi:GT2 family glycosyltransferase
LESICQIEYPNCEIILVDNGSTDDSLLKIREYADGILQAESPFYNYCHGKKPITTTEYTKEEVDSILGMNGAFLTPKEQLLVIKNDHNYGFAEGNNIGIRVALARESSYVLLLNNDVIVHPSFLTELVLAAERDERVGFAGPKVYFCDYSGRPDVINFAGGSFSLWTGSARHIGLRKIDHGQFNDAKLVDFLDGSCILARRETILETGPLKADYFTYWEDVEWCLRGARSGYKSAYVPSAKIWHKVGASKKEKSSRAYYYYARNLLWLAKENASMLQLAFFISFFLTITIWTEIGISIVFHRSVKQALSFLKGTIDGLRARSS